MAVVRSPHNPIITPGKVKPSRSDFKVVCTFNPGVARFNGETILLIRVAEVAVSDNRNIIRVPVYNPALGDMEIIDLQKDDPEIDFSDPRFVKTPTGKYLTSISHLRLARSRDGIHFKVDDNPAISAGNEYETFGVEDARITHIGDTYYISYSGISERGVTTCLASTKDFASYKRHGIIFLPDNKDVTIFPEKIGKKYYALNRPTSLETKKREVWIAESPDLVSWGNHRHVLGLRDNGWENERLGASAVPFMIDDGWLEIYHAADNESRYCLGAALLDKHEPWKVLGRSEVPIMEPVMDYELYGFFGNVVFTCGALYEKGKVTIYYGAADTCIGYARIPLEDILAGVK